MKTPATKTTKKAMPPVSIEHLVAGGIIAEEQTGLGGSRHLITIKTNGRIAKILLDMGGTMVRMGEVGPNPFEFIPHPRTIDAAVLSHAHFDHTGDLVPLTKGTPTLSKEEKKYNKEKKPVLGYNKEIVTTAKSKIYTNLIARDTLAKQAEAISQYNDDLRKNRKSIQAAIKTVHAYHGKNGSRNAKRPLLSEKAYLQSCDLLNSYGINPHTVKKETDSAVAAYKPQYKEVGYDSQDIDKLIAQMKPQELGKEFPLIKNFVTATFYAAGHISGSVQVLLKVMLNPRKPHQTFNILYSGDLGRFKQPGLAGSPEIPTEKVDYVIMESTYGDRNHKDREGEVKELVTRIKERKGPTIIPTFTLEKLQEVLITLEKQHEYGNLPLRENERIYVYSPLGAEITKAYMKHEESEAYERLMTSKRITWITTPEELAELHEKIDKKEKTIIVCSGGMGENGTIMAFLHQITKINTAQILLTGYQAPGTIGYKLMENDFAEPIKVNGETIPYNAAKIRNHSFSGHADQEELIHWVSSLNLAHNAAISLVHGGAQRVALAAKLRELFPLPTPKIAPKKKPVRATRRMRLIPEQKITITVPERNGSIIPVYPAQ